MVEGVQGGASVAAGCLLQAFGYHYGSRVWVLALLFGWARSGCTRPAIHGLLECGSVTFTRDPFLLIAQHLLITLVASMQGAHIAVRLLTTTAVTLAGDADGALRFRGVPHARVRHSSTAAQRTDRADGQHTEDRTALQLR